jgi:predicted pyridoxine 5'-phosphate oxidase superfamily flavin-nucleotide-binding protein
MSRAFARLAFTPGVQDMQTRMGSRKAYAKLDDAGVAPDVLTDSEIEFIESRDGFHQATVSETGWPYVQFRGGPPGFLKVLDGRTIAYADFRGNVQYISVGNLQTNDRVSIILMDYATRSRLKLLGRVRIIDSASDPALMERLRMPDYGARIERAVVITVEAFDWNCQKHITPRYTMAEVDAAVAPLRQALEAAQRELAELKAQRAVQPVG